MGVVKNQGVKTSIVLYAGAFVGIVSRVFLLPKALSPEQIGFIDNVLYLAIILSSMAMLGMTSSITRFLPRFEKQKQSTLMGVLMLLMLFSSSVFILVLIFNKNLILQIYPKNQELFEQYYWVLPTLLGLMTLRAYFISYSTAYRKIIVPSIINEFWVKVFTAISLTLILINVIDFNGYMSLYIFMYIVVCVAMLWYVIDKLGFRIRFNISILKKDYKEILNYSFFTFLLVLTAPISMYIDTIMLGSLKGLAYSGIYSVAFIIGSSIELPKRAIMSISFPVLSELFHKEDYKSIESLYKKSSITQGFIASLFLIVIWFSIDNLFALIPNSDIYAQGKYVVLMIALSKWVDMITGVNSQILIASTKYRYDIVMTIFLIAISVVLNLILIPIFELNGAAVATFLSVTLYNFARFILVYKLFGTTPFSANTLKLVLIFLVFLALSFTPILVGEGNSVLANILFIMVKTLIIGIPFIFITYKWSISEDINNLIRDLIRVRL